MELVLQQITIFQTRFSIRIEEQTCLNRVQRLVEYQVSVLTISLNLSDQVARVLLFGRLREGRLAVQTPIGLGFPNK